MKIHLDAPNPATVLMDALDKARESGGVAQSVYFDLYERRGSHSRLYSMDVHLGSNTKVAGDKRRAPNANGTDKYARYAATWKEWGWFLANVFETEHNAIAGQYRGRADFHAKTRYQFLTN